MQLSSQIIVTSYVWCFLLWPSAFAQAIQSDEEAPSLVLPVNVTGFLAKINETTPTTVLPGEPSDLEDIVWPDNLASFAPTATQVGVSSSTATAGPPNIVCDGKKYGRNLRELSCVEAYNKMLVSSEPVTFGQRGHGEWTTNLPFRILSSDGLCAIDISTRQGVISDEILPSDLKQSARILLQICVSGKPSQGGVIGNIGMKGGLAIRFTRYKPSVHCDSIGSRPPWKDCRDIIDSMPVDGQTAIFGHRNSTDPRVNYRLPAELNTWQRRCEVVVGFLKPEVLEDTYDWYKLWAAANAIDYMCLQYGRSGVSIGHGTDRALFVEIRDLVHPPRPPLDSSVA